MKNLATKNVDDFTVDSIGNAFISQSAVSRCTGIPQQTISDWVRKNSVGYNLNENNQLDAKSLQKLVIVGSSKYPSCLAFMGKLLEAGAKAYIYHEAGYSLTATPKLTHQQLWLKEHNSGMLVRKDTTDTMQDFINLWVVIYYNAGSLNKAGGK